MSDIAIRVENLSKRYRIGLKEEMHDTLASALTDLVTRPVRNLRRLRKLTRFDDGNVKRSNVSTSNASDIIWALKDISFEVKRGEVVGIIGRNGAGKSTLLKILSRITHPTSGRVETYSRVSSLLEVGTGFHPELTGRENIYLNGTILGMTKAEIDKKFDEIVDFSGVEKFIDTPVKRYSSGMRVRLAFSVAAHLEPEILLVDEVLAVGDAEFQKKCLGKMGDVAKAGRTVLFVSHNMVAVQSLCKRVIWLNDGKIVKEGEPVRVVSSYLQTSAMGSIRAEQVWNDIDTAPGNNMVRLHRVCVRPENGSPSDLITVRTPLVMEFEFWNLIPGTSLNLNFHLLTEQEVVAFASAPDPAHEPVWCGRPFPGGLFRSVCHIPGDLLNAGLYHVRVLIGEYSRRIIFRYENVLSFEVHDSSERRGAFYGKLPGAVRPLLRWNTEFVNKTKPAFPGDSP